MMTRQVFIFLSMLNILFAAINYSHGNYENIVINIIALLACLTAFIGEKR